VPHWAVVACLQMSRHNESRGLKQAEAAELLGIKQPDVSKMLRGEFRQFSVERLLQFLVSLDRMWRSWSNRIAAETMPPRFMCRNSLAVEGREGTYDRQG